MEEIIIATVGGAAVSFLLERLKRKYEFSGRLALAVICLTAGAAYAGFKYFIPEALQTEIVTFVLLVFGSATAVYEFVVRVIYKGEPPSFDILEKPQ